MDELIMVKRIRLFFLLAASLLPCLGTAGSMLQPFEPNSLQNIVERHKGKPFMLFVWSLDCVYCQASLDHLAKAKRDNQGLTIVTLSTDLASDPQAAEMMQKRLSSLQLSGDAWAFGSAAPEKLKYALDPKWYGEKPRSYWFNAQGERIGYSGVLNPDTIEKLYRKVAQ
ncbi:MAG: TlpA family protein disulfide reductase [Burkholderiaceae bacterium]